MSYDKTNDVNLPVATATSLAPVLTMNDNLTVNDILSVAVGKVETALRAKLKTSEKNLKALEKSAKTTEKEIEKASKELLVSCGLKAELEAIKEPLEKLLPRESFKALVHPKITIDREKNIVSYVYSVGYNNGTREVEFDGELIDLFERLDQERDNLALEQAEQMSIRSKMSNMPTLERRYKGMLAESQLQKSEKGKELLDTLTLNLDKEIEEL